MTQSNLSLQILVGLYHCDEDIESMDIFSVSEETYHRHSAEAYAIAADWMEDIGATADDVARVANRLFRPEEWRFSQLDAHGDAVAKVMYQRENPQLEAEYDAAFAHLS